MSVCTHNVSKNLHLAPPTCNGKVVRGGVRANGQGVEVSPTLSKLPKYLNDVNMNASGEAVAMMVGRMSERGDWGEGWLDGRLNSRRAGDQRMEGEFPRGDWLCIRRWGWG